MTQTKPASSRHAPDLAAVPVDNDNTSNNSSSSDELSDSVNSFEGSHQELDFISLSSSSSIPLNLITKLNQISSPVTRRLKFWNKKSVQLNQYDPNFKVFYLGNMGVQTWSRDEQCLDKPIETLWNNYLVNMKSEIVMRMTICNSGLKATTRQYGLTQYWSNRLVHCCAPKNFTRIFSWVYRHEGKKMRQELRCHAVLCASPEKAIKMANLLNERLAYALQEFRREKKSRSLSIQSNNLSPVLSTKLHHRSKPLRRRILEKGSANFRLPLERSKSAPRLTSIIEEEEENEEEEEYDDNDDEIGCDDDGIECDEADYRTNTTNGSIDSDSHDTKEAGVPQVSMDCENKGMSHGVHAGSHSPSEARFTKTRPNQFNKEKSPVGVEVINRLLSDMVILPEVEGTEPNSGPPHASATYVLNASIKRKLQ